MKSCFAMICVLVCTLHAAAVAQKASAATSGDIDATTLEGKVMCGYQGWFRCPGDPSNEGWVHWSRDSKRIAPETLSVEMWPDLTGFDESERFAAPGFKTAAGRPCYLFSSDSAPTVLRHFQWMHDYGIDGVWLQEFVVDLPGGPAQKRYASRSRVLQHVREAATQTGRVWAITFDVSGMPTDRIYDVLTDEWKMLVQQKVVADPRYLHHTGKPVVQLFGFYRQTGNTGMTADIANRLIDFFKADGPNSAYLVGAGDWDWRRNRDPQWQAVYRRLDCYEPWNVGNTSRDGDKVRHAATARWADDKADFEQGGRMWMPVVYPGFSWDNLKRLPPGTSAIPRRGGKFLWEQFVELSKLKPHCVFMAMFDEVDEGTAIFKVAADPPANVHFVGYEGLPADWYLRLVGEGTRMLRGARPVSAEIPIQP